MQIPSSSSEKRRLLLKRNRDVSLFLLVSMLASIVGCHSQVHSEVRSTQQKAPSPSSRDLAVLCESIKDIEVLPFKDEPVPDPAYNLLASAGDDAIPCLIRKITDETKMADPRRAPKVGFVYVGDTAFFVLAHIAKLDQATFVEFLPPDVRKAYEGGEGIYGYFRYINNDHNRKKLQDAAVKWYEKKYGRSLP